MAMRNKNFKSSVGHSMVDYMLAVLGNTTSDPTIPANGRFTPTTATFPVADNAISIVSTEAPSRSSTGIYVLTVSADFMAYNILNAHGSVLSAGASPTTALYVICSIADPVARQVTARVYAPGGTLTDLGTSDMLVVTVHAQDTAQP